MRKRSKLDLSSDTEQGKSQAAGFDPEAPQDSTPEPAPQYDEAHASGGINQSRDSVAIKHKPSTGVMIAKTVAVVAVAALSLYVLKRRLL